MTRGPLLALLACLTACFAPEDDGHVDGSTGDLGSSSAAGASTGASETAPTSAATTSASSMSASGPSGSETTARPDDDGSTTDDATTDGSSEASTAGTTGADASGSGDASSGDETTAAIDPCALGLETFDVDPDWIWSGLPDGGNVYGWSGATSHAGGELGELGGTFQRTLGDSYYADGIELLDATHCIAASGRLVVTRKDADFNDNANIGHFSVDGGAHVGFAVVENVDGVRIFVSAGGLFTLAFEVDDPDVPRTWSYAYDPVAATMTLDLEDYGSVTHDLTDEEIAAIADIDAFGLRNPPTDAPELAPGLLELWIDDAEYTR